MDEVDQIYSSQPTEGEATITVRAPSRNSYSIQFNLAPNTALCHGSSRCEGDTCQSGSSASSSSALPSDTILTPSAGLKSEAPVGSLTTTL